MAVVLLDRLISVGIVDDSESVRGALRFFLGRIPNLKVVAEAKDGFEAIAMVEAFRPDVVLMDISMPILDGIEATRIIRSKFLDTKVIVLTMNTDQFYSENAFQAGACQFLPKDGIKEKLLTAINECSPGQRMIAGHPLN